jgi:hypothetical protein
MIIANHASDFLRTQALGILKGSNCLVAGTGRLNPLYRGEAKPQRRSSICIQNPCTRVPASRGLSNRDFFHPVSISRIPKQSFGPRAFFVPQANIHGMRSWSQVPLRIGSVKTH